MRNENGWTSFTACGCVEGFDGENWTEVETISAWQYLIDTGLCWTLQGWYGRNAATLIEAGYCERGNNE